VAKNVILAFEIDYFYVVVTTYKCKRT